MASPCEVQELVQQAPPEIPAQHVMELTPSGVEPLVWGDDGIGLYRLKGPFVQSGKSTRGHFMMDPATEKLQCHECGVWTEAPLMHGARKGHIPRREYLRKHGFRCDAVAVSPRIHAQSVEHAKGLWLKNLGPTIFRIRNDPDFRAESTERLLKASLEARKERGSTFSGSRQNEKMKCRAQCKASIKELNATLGHGPSLGEMRRLKGITRFHLRYAFNMEPAEVVRALGMQPRPSTIPEWSDEELLDEVRNFHAVKGRLPFGSDFSNGTLPSYNLFLKRFGSLQNLFIRAGLGLVYRKWETARSSAKVANN